MTYLPRAATHAATLTLLFLTFTLYASAQVESLIYSFGNDAANVNLSQSELVIDSLGNLYGTTPFGGIGGCGSIDCGNVFEITPIGAGTWALTNYYLFTGGTDGEFPLAGLALDKAGN